MSVSTATKLINLGVGATFGTLGAMAYCGDQALPYYDTSSATTSSPLDKWGEARKSESLPSYSAEGRWLDAVTMFNSPSLQNLVVVVPPYEESGDDWEGVSTVQPSRAFRARGVLTYKGRGGLVW